MPRSVLHENKEGSEMMKINGVNGINAPVGAMGMAQANDPVSKNIQNQIAEEQKKLQDLSSNDELSAEEKQKKRQEIQQEITNLKQQLRQHQMEQRKEQQSKKSSSVEDMVAGPQSASAKKGTGLSQASMQSMISADASMKQAKVQGRMAAQTEGRANVLASEIRKDAGSGNTEKKEEELAELQAKAQSATAAQMSTLSDANRSMEEAAKTDKDTETTETKKNNTGKAEKTENAEGKAETATEKDPDAEEGQTVTGLAGYRPVDVRL